MPSSPTLPHKNTGLASDAQKATQVESMFNRIAGTYDLLNDCISLGLHRGWKKRACQRLQLKPGANVLDVCTGTGDLLAYLLELVGPNGQVTGLDFSIEMLAKAEERYREHTCHRQITLQQGDALALPYPDNTFDGAVISFGLRNVADIPKAISEMTRVVKPGAWVVNLDTCPESRLPGFKLYFNYVMPVIGRLLSMDAQAYQYLSKSTEGFLTPTALVSVFQQAQLQHVRAEQLAFGAASLQAGQKQ